MVVPAATYALDRAELAVISNGGDWLISWYPPDHQPEGTPHGATGVCVTDFREVVLVSEDGQRWGFPGGRPERGEDWIDTLRRELEEEACIGVLRADLIGWGRGQCLSGPEEGLVLVRSMWSVRAELYDWEPEFEMKHRRLCAPDQARQLLHMEPGMEPIYLRQLREAGLPHG